MATLCRESERDLGFFTQNTFLFRIYEQGRHAFIIHLGDSHFHHVTAKFTVSSTIIAFLPLLNFTLLEVGYIAQSVLSRPILSINHTLLELIHKACLIEKDTAGLF